MAAVRRSKLVIANSYAILRSCFPEVGTKHEDRNGLETLIPPIDVALAPVRKRTDQSSFRCRRMTELTRLYESDCAIIYDEDVMRRRRVIITRPTLSPTISVALPLQCHKYSVADPTH